MSCVCARALRSMVATARSRVASSSCPPWRSLVQPTMALSGVRSSWDSVARNSSLSRFASWASRYRRALSAASAPRSARLCASDRSASVKRRPTAPSTTQPNVLLRARRGTIMLEV